MNHATEKPHLSATQLEMYWRCPEQYRRRYLEKEILLPGIAQITGRGLHKGAETNFKQKIESHQDLSTTEIVEAAVAGFETDVAGGYALTREENSRGTAVVLGEAKDQTAQLARAHAKLQAPDYQPIEVEHTTRIVLPHASHDLLAITDLRDDQRRITDLKTAAKRKPESEVHSSIQLTIYAAAYQIDHGEPPAEVRLDVLTKTKTPARQVLASTRDTSDFRVLVARMNATLDAITFGVFAPCSPGSWGCSPKWCGYARTCPYFNSERLAAAESE